MARPRSNANPWSAIGEGDAAARVEARGGRRGRELDTIVDTWLRDVRDEMSREEAVADSDPAALRLKRKLKLSAAYRPQQARVSDSSSVYTEHRDRAARLAPGPRRAVSLRKGSVDITDACGPLRYSYESERSTDEDLAGAVVDLCRAVRDFCADDDDDENEEQLAGRGGRGWSGQERGDGAGEQKPSRPMLQKRTQELAVPPSARMAARGRLVRNPPTRPQREHEVFYETGAVHVVKRKDSVLSNGTTSFASRVVPLSKDRVVERAVHFNKPLPPIPQLKPAPKPQRSKPTYGAYMVGMAVGGMPFPGHCEGCVQPAAEPKKGSQNPSPFSSPWKSLTEKRAAKAREALKSKISRPGPLMSENGGYTANIAVQCGGVGGPGAARSLPISRDGTPLTRPAPVKCREARLPPPWKLEQLASWKKGKQDDGDDRSRGNWQGVLDSLTKSAGKRAQYMTKRQKSSDMSFKCRGL